MQCQAWTDPATNTELFTFTIITTTPNPVVGTYHDREPVQLPRELESAWLNPDFPEPEQIMPLLKTSSPEEMESWHVSDAARNPKKRLSGITHTRCCAIKPDKQLQSILRECNLLKHIKQIFPAVSVCIIIRSKLLHRFE